MSLRIYGKSNNKNWQHNFNHISSLKYVFTYFDNFMVILIEKKVMFVHDLSHHIMLLCIFNELTRWNGDLFSLDMGGSGSYSVKISREGLRSREKKN